MQKIIVQYLKGLCQQRFYSYKAVRRPDLSVNARKLTAPQIVSERNLEENLCRSIKAKILATGPITVADYMREVLTHPSAGYYMNRDVFGREGDFITSPEISQIFGELVGIWVYTEWRKLGSPVPFQIVELGPGRGTLTRDVLKVLTQLKLTQQFSIHLVEISNYLSKLQAQRFCFEHQEVQDQQQPFYQTGKTATNINAFWYKRIEDVPQQFSIVLAHEFFDALPVHKLQLVEGQWREVLIDVNEQRTSDDNDFRFILSKSQTPVSKLFKPIAGEQRQALEYSLESDRIVRLLAERFESNGGIGLIMDYGHNGEKTDTFRAFKNHKLFEPLKAPGTADLTADVDFRQLRCSAECDEKAICFGPVEQGVFLELMQGQARLQKLLDNALPENQEIIKTGYKMLTDSTQMGSRFKFFAMYPNVLKQHLKNYPVTAFVDA